MSISELIAQQPVTFSDTTTVPATEISRICAKQQISIEDFRVLLSSGAATHLELLAQAAAEQTRLHFGNAVILFTPMYLSNYCTNVCPYCSFSKHHSIHRKQLSISEIVAEAKQIAASGIRHLLVLTGEAPTLTPVSYIKEAIASIGHYFSSVAIEIFPLSTDDYRSLFAAGADSLTLYQETYQKDRYQELHPAGPKADYKFRLDAPERACIAGARAVTIGALYGLSDWRNDAFLTGLHAAYLQKKYPHVNIGISFPRLRPQSGTFAPACIVSDRELVQMLAALRIFLPSAGITMSTRESAEFRMNVLPIGVTKMSAGVSTSVGGHTTDSSTPQFEIADDRDVATIGSDLLAAGYQPVLHDWSHKLFTADYVLTSAHQ